MSEVNQAGTDVKHVSSQAAKNLDVTAYQGGQAVVREKRVVKLPKGTSKVSFEGLPQQFVPGSLTVVSYEGKGEFKLGPISYRPANLSAAAILSKSIGQAVTFQEPTAAGIVTVDGILRYVLGHQAVVESEGALYIAPIGQRYSIGGSMPDGLTAKASLLLEPTVKEEGEFTVNILYETNGIEWDSRYEAFYNSKTETISRFTCWVDLLNKSGTDLTDATIKLIASTNYGSGRRAKSAPVAGPMMASFGGGGLESTSFVADAAQSESVGEQKLYTLPDRISLDDGESKQTVLTMVDSVPVKQEYFAGAGQYHERLPRNHEEVTKEPVFVRLSLTNSVASKLGKPLPPGPVTIFEPDQSGSLQKTDSASIGHVAEDEQFKLTLTNPSKDLKVTRILLVEPKQDPEPPRTKPVPPAPGAEEVKPAPRYREEHREIVVYNFKDKDVEIQLSEIFPSWEQEFLSASEHFTDAVKKSGKLTVQVAAKGQTKLNYRIKFRLS